jgi:hypothetical protein
MHLPTVDGNRIALLACIRTYVVNLAACLAIYMGSHRNERVSEKVTSFLITLYYNTMLKYSICHCFKLRGKISHL